MVLIWCSGILNNLVSNFTDFDKLWGYRRLRNKAFFFLLPWFQGLDNTRFFASKNSENDSTDGVAESVDDEWVVERHDGHAGDSSKEGKICHILENIRPW